MANINKVILVGRLGKDPIMKKNANGKSMTTFSLATNNYIKPGVETTDWHTIRVYGKQAEHCAQYLKKGQLCYVEGKMQQYKIERENKVRYFSEVLATKVSFLSKSKPQPQSELKIEESIPF